MLDLILIVVVLLLIFGGGKLREAGSDLGSLVKSARRAIRGGDSRPAANPDAQTRPGTQPGVLPDAEFPEQRAARENRRD